MLQVISGKYKGYKIKTIKSINIKPMMSRIKKDLFNILDNYFIYKNKIGLDIFSGSGQLGIEGLSRGLQKCYFNDLDYDAFKIIKINLNKLQINNFEIFNYDYKILLNLIIFNKILIDILFLNPPFKQIEYYYDIITIILNNNIINKYGIIICESNQKLLLERFKLNLLRWKIYKKKHLYIFRL